MPDEKNREVACVSDGVIERYSMSTILPEAVFGVI